MKDFKGKVAVIVGAGSGIGRAIALRCVEEGMRVALAGINMDTLARVEAEVIARGGAAVCVQTDVSRPEDVQGLADRVLEVFGEVHLLVNSAGVYAGSSVWESTPQDWKWVLDVNLWGTLHCLRAFVPIMLAQGGEGHIVNVSSIAGMMTFPGWGPYKVTKAGQNVLSETLRAELAARGAPIGVSVFCPGFVQTNLSSAARNRPADLSETSRDEAIEQGIREGMQVGMPPDQILEPLFAGIRANQLYIFSHPWSEGVLRERFDSILADAARVNQEVLD